MPALLLKSLIGFEDQDAHLTMDAVFDGKTLTRITVDLLADKTVSGSFDRNNAVVYASVSSTPIEKRDNTIMKMLLFA